MPQFERWLSAPADLPPNSTSFVGLDDLGKGLVLSALSQRTTEPVIAVFGSRAAARNAVDNFLYFAGRDARSRVHYLPSIDFDYYRGLLPNPELLCERNVALYHALNDAGGRVFVTTVSALLQKVVPPREFSDAVRRLKPGDEIVREDLVTNLFEAGYQRQPVAHDRCSFHSRRRDRYFLSALRKAGTGGILRRRHRRDPIL